MNMKIPINLLKTCPINYEIYRDSDVGDLVNSIGDVGLLQPVDNIPSHRKTIGHLTTPSKSYFWFEELKLIAI
jgi:hypothetical protein